MDRWDHWGSQRDASVGHILLWVSSQHPGFLQHSPHHSVEYFRYLSLQEDWALWEQSQVVLICISQVQSPFSCSEGDLQQWDMWRLRTSRRLESSSCFWLSNPFRKMLTCFCFKRHLREIWPYLPKTPHSPTCCMILLAAEVIWVQTIRLVFLEKRDLCEYGFCFYLSHPKGSASAKP